MKTQKVTVIASAICLFAVFGSFAQEKKKKQTPEQIFEKFDKNEDGEITKEELEGKKFLNRFDKLDQDENGAITLEELKKGMKKKGKGKKAKKEKPVSDESPEADFDENEDGGEE